MTAYSNLTLWVIILVTAVITFLIRWSFLGVIGARAMPEWLTRMLRYTAAAVLPGLVAPTVLWPEVTGGQPDPSRLLAMLVAVLVGVWLRNLLAAVLAGMLAFWGVAWLLG